MAKTVRTEEIKIFDSFKDAVNDTNYKIEKIDVEDFEFPETIEVGQKAYRKKWLNNKRVYLYYDNVCTK
jgi:hypothetical protein